MPSATTRTHHRRRTMAELVQNMPQPLARCVIYALAADFNADTRTEGRFPRARRRPRPRRRRRGRCSFDGNCARASVFRPSGVLASSGLPPNARTVQAGEDTDMRVPEEVIPEWSRRSLICFPRGQQAADPLGHWTPLFAKLPERESLNMKIADESARSPCAASASSVLPALATKAALPALLAFLPRLILLTTPAQLTDSFDDM
ncbi:hypothetical protein DL771_007050 [Monosporascus sp. 5C6A]|nr:hypothetical protein DL771_007050 [Monosporascus sp. 5C6A]